MLGRRFQTTFFVCLALLFGLPTGLRADESFSDRVEGPWTATVSESKGREEIDEAVDDVVAEVIFFKRPFVRKRLRDSAEPCSTIWLKIGDEKITMQCDDRNPTISPKDGTSTDWTSHDDQTYTLSQHVKSDRIVQIFESDRGIRTNTYSLKDDETLVLDVEIDGDQIPEPLTYRREFERME